MRTQPWVSTKNPIGWVWVNEVRRMLHEGAMNRERIEEDVRLGYIRPSLLIELDFDVDAGTPDEKRLKMLERIDKEAGYVMHKEVYENKRRRSEAIKAYEAKLSRETRGVIIR
jgi:hypothetical protein